MLKEKADLENPSRKKNIDENSLSKQEDQEDENKVVIKNKSEE